MTDQPGIDAQEPLARKNVLLSATIAAGALKVPVRIRSLSDSCAMLDGTVLPDPGTVLTLRRLQLEIGATVIWCDAGRCDVAFEGKVSVEDWVAGNCLPQRFVTPGQARVDAIQFALRRGEAPPEEAPTRSGGVAVFSLSASVSRRIGAPVEKA